MGQQVDEEGKGMPRRSDMCKGRRNDRWVLMGSEGGK